MIRRAGNVIYSGYCLVIFSLVFLGLFPLFFVFIQRKQWHKYALKLNYYWTALVLFFWGKKLEVVFEKYFDKNENYIFCPNHFSYLDILAMGITPVNFCFVGKSSIAKIPIFGYMFRKLHIAVDRNSLRSKYDTFLRAGQAIEDGSSLVIFPEGGMKSENPPEMVRFKDGAFRVAIEKQIPIIPVTIPYNWILLPDRKVPLMQLGKLKVIYHEPIETKGLGIEDLNEIREKTYSVIDSELKKHCIA